MVKSITTFPKIVCPICNAEVISLSKNRIFEHCGKKFLAEPRANGFVIKEVLIKFCKSCKRARINIKKIY